MKLLAVFSVIALTSKSIANCDAYDSFAEVLEDNASLERECSSLMGGGSKYYGKIISATENAPVICNGYPATEGYVLIYGCNTCPSKDV